MNLKIKGNTFLNWAFKLKYEKALNRIEENKTKQKLINKMKNSFNHFINNSNNKPLLR